MDQSLNNVPNLLRELNEIGVALSAEKDHNHLLELILVKAMDITNSDGGTLYICINEKSLKFEILHNRSLAIHKGGTSGEDILLPPIPLYDEQGNKNNKMIAAYAVYEDYPIIPCDLCGSQPLLQRQQVKQLMTQWEKDYPNRKAVMLNALKNISPSHLLDKNLFDFKDLEKAHETIQVIDDSHVLI